MYSRPVSGHIWPYIMLFNNLTFIHELTASVTFQCDMQLLGQSSLSKIHPLEKAVKLFYLWIYCLLFGTKSLADAP
jgi:hypothetical protein